METKVEKQSVCIKEPLKTETAEHPIDSEIILPDSYPDIARILKCTGNAKIVSKQMAGELLNMEGSVALDLIYVNEQGELCFYSQNLPFYHEAPLPEGEFSPAVQCKTEYCNCRMVNTRKIEIHSAVTLHITMNQIHHIPVITNVQDPTVQLLTREEEITTRIGQGEKNLSITDEIQVPAGNVRSILRCQGRICKGECKAVSGKALVKGELEVYALYLTTDGGYDCITGNLPFTQIVELEDGDESCLCHPTFQVCELELRPRTGLDGECKNIMVSATVQIQVEGFKTMTLPVITDCFSTKWGLDIQRHTGNLQKLLCHIGQSHICKKQLELGRDMGSIIDVWCTGISHRTGWDDNILTVTGILSVAILAKDTDGVPVLIEKAFDYTWNSDTIQATHSVTFFPHVSLEQIAYTLTGADTMELRVSFHINGKVMETLPHHPITQMALDETAPVSPPPAPLVIYYAKEGETVFDIARRYNTTCEAIQQANHITESTLPGGPLLIPSAG